MGKEVAANQDIEDIENEAEDEDIPEGEVSSEGDKPNGGRDFDDFTSEEQLEDNLTDDNEEETDEDTETEVSEEDENKAKTDDEKADKPSEKVNFSDDMKGELEKRYGKRTDQEYLAELYKSYRQIEPEYQKATMNLSHFEKLIDKAGGIDNLLKAVAQPREEKPVVEEKTETEKKIEELVKQGELDPDNLKDKLFIESLAKTIALEKREMEREQKNIEEKVEIAFNVFDKKLNELSTKYPDADPDIIRTKAFNGAYAELDNKSLWLQMEKELKMQQEKFDSKVGEGTKNSMQKKLEAMRKAKQTSTIAGSKNGVNTQGKKTVFETFSDAYDKRFKN